MNPLLPSLVSQLHTLIQELDTLGLPPDDRLMTELYECLSLLAISVANQHVISDCVLNRLSGAISRIDTFMPPSFTDFIILHNAYAELRYELCAFVSCSGDPLFALLVEANSRAWPDATEIVNKLIIDRLTSVMSSKSVRKKSRRSEIE